MTERYPLVRCSACVFRLSRSFCKQPESGKVHQLLRQFTKKDGRPKAAVVHDLHHLGVQKSYCTEKRTERGACQLVGVR